MQRAALFYASVHILNGSPHFAVESRADPIAPSLKSWYALSLCWSAFRSVRLYFHPDRSTKFMCVIFPTGYIFATSRYAILEDLGCSIVFEYSRLWLAVAFVPDLLVAAATAVFAGKICCNSSCTTPILSRYGGPKPYPLSNVHSMSRLSIFIYEMEFRSHARDLRYSRCLAVICQTAGVFHFESH
jgi:hypothetical protein